LFRRTKNQQISNYDSYQEGRKEEERREEGKERKMGGGVVLVLESVSSSILYLDNLFQFQVLFGCGEDKRCFCTRRRRRTALRRRNNRTLSSISIEIYLSHMDEKRAVVLIIIIIG